MWVAAVGVLILVSVLGTTSISNEPSTTASGRTIGYLFNGSRGGSERHRNLAGTADLSTTAPGRSMRRTPGQPRTYTPPAPSVTPTTEAPPTTTAPATDPSSGLSVHVDGNELVNGSGQKMRLLGVDVTGTESACIQDLGLSVGASNTPAEDAASATAIASWHMNAVRIPLNEDCWLDINGAPAAYSGASYQTAIANWVAALNADGIITILDLQWAAPGSYQSNEQWPMADEDHAPAFWTSVAAAFKSDPAVIFDLFNEPYIGQSSSVTSPTSGTASTPWGCWLEGCDVTGGKSDITYQTAGMQQLVTTVRATGATQPIMLGGLEYATDPCGYNYNWGDHVACPELSNLPVDPLHQLIISFHTYTTSNDTSVASWNYNLAQLNAANIPMVTGELGEDDCSTSYMNTYMTWADSNDESYLAWSWTPYSGPQPEACQSSPSPDDWTNWELLQNWGGAPSTATPQGAYYKAHLAVVYPSE